MRHDGLHLDSLPAMLQSFGVVGITWDALGPALSAALATDSGGGAAAAAKRQRLSLPSGPVSPPVGVLVFF